MRIVSKFTDYYDWVSNKYGRDPDIVYLRKKIEIDNVITERNITKYFLPGWHSVYHFSFIVVGMRVFVFIKEDEPKTGKQIPVSFEEFKKRVDFEIKWNENIRNFCTKRNFGIPDDVSIRLIRIVKAPVFVIEPRGYDSLLIHEKVPVLQEYGFPAIVSPEEVWKSIYFALQNVLRVNPDKLPPVMVANDDMIVEKGFDLKTSFRGREPKNRKR